MDESAVAKTSTHRIGAVWLLILPIGLIVSVLALPFFAALWIFEWIVPMPRLDLPDDPLIEDSSLTAVAKPNPSHQ